MDEQYTENNSLVRKNLFKDFIQKKPKTSIVIFFVLILLVLYFFLQRPGGNFPMGQVVTIYPGESLQEITNTLYDSGVIKSPLIFRSTVILLSGEKRVMAGDYILDKKE